jgi:AcrR family transcriptional regulator
MPATERTMTDADIASTSPDAGQGARPDGDGPGLTKREQRRVSVDKLSAAALHLFITQGYHATSVEEIAGAAGLTKGAVYFYFKSKAGVLLELLDRVEDATVVPTIQAVGAAGPDARDKLVAFMHAQSLAGADRAELMMLAILMSTEFHGSGDPIEERLHELMGRLHSLVEGIVAEGRREGVFRADLGLRETASLLLAVNQGCFVEWYRRGRELDGPEFVRAMRSIVLEGVRAPVHTAYGNQPNRE